MKSVSNNVYYLIRHSVSGSVTSSVSFGKSHHTVANPVSRSVRDSVSYSVRTPIWGSVARSLRK